MMLQSVAPTGEVNAYDQRHLALYAELIDAEAVGMDWREVATVLMGLNPDGEGTELCWRSHLERAQWIIGDGLSCSIEAFGTLKD